VSFLYIVMEDIHTLTPYKKHQPCRRDSSSQSTQCVTKLNRISSGESKRRSCQLTIKPLVVLALVVMLVGIAHGSSECGRASADRVALHFASCISSTDDLQSTPTSGCCSTVHTIGRSPNCLYAVMLSGTTRAAGIKPEVAITIPKRCNMADRRVGYKCGGTHLNSPVIKHTFNSYQRNICDCSSEFACLGIDRVHAALTISCLVIKKRNVKNGYMRWNKRVPRL
jgi:hypothetical protein